jgi:hypothetical protein
MNLPKNALVNKKIPKNKFYEKLVVSNKLKNDFIKKIEKIEWTYKLSEDKINISKTKNVKEIQIFTIYLKEKEIPKNILQIIDKGVPYPILYIFKYKDNFAYGISLKKEKRVEDYYFSKWNEVIEFNFNGLNLESVYENIIRKFISRNQVGKNFSEIIEKEKEIKELQKEIQILENKIKNTAQFNKKLEFNKELNKKKHYLKKIKNG